MIYRKFYTLALFGHRDITNKQEVRKILYDYLKHKIKGQSVRVLIGTHGDFDRIALGVCKQLKNEGYNIDICVVFTSQKQLIKEMELDKYSNDYKNIETMMYEIEDMYYKRQIIVSNQKMIDDSDEIMVYYNGKQLFNNNGTYRIMQYAKRQNKRVININNLMKIN